ncbi:hypothetical protein EYS21_21195 [Arthrobacter sp. S39]|nr:hypothetical protein EYS21_21195 [Arthrobacter sp. S39]
MHTRCSVTSSVQGTVRTGPMHEVWPGHLIVASVAA